MFTKSRPIIANFHGYPETLRGILGRYTDISRIRVHGYMEQGSTTTPFEMLSLNDASRYHLAMDVARLEKRDDLIVKYQKILDDNHAYAYEHGIDQTNKNGLRSRRPLVGKCERSELIHIDYATHITGFIERLLAVGTHNALNS